MKSNKHNNLHSLTFGKFRSLFNEGGPLGSHGLLALLASSHPATRSCLDGAGKDDVVSLINLNIEGDEFFLVTRGELPLRSLSAFSPSVLNEWHTKRYPAVNALYDLRSSLSSHLVRNHNPVFNTRLLFGSQSYAVVSRALADTLRVLEDELAHFLSVKKDVDDLTSVEFQAIPASEV